MEGIVMLTVSVCIGSACHRRGSYAILTRLKALVAEHGLGDRISVVPMFCMGECQNGVSVKVGDKLHLGMTCDNADLLFEQTVLPLLN